MTPTWLTERTTKINVAIGAMEDEIRRLPPNTTGCPDIADRMREVIAFFELRRAQYESITIRNA